MKLFYGAVSPFVRKVMVLAHEKNLVAQLQLVPSPLTPTEPNAGLMRVNPLGKMPTLMLDDGTVLFDSPVICEYLDGLGAAPVLIPKEGKARLRALCLNALGDGLLDAAVAARIESMRPEDKQWDKWRDAQLLKVKSALDAMESRDAMSPSADTLTLGEIAVGCALGWLDFRMPQLAWRDGHPRLAHWYAAFSARASMTATAPELPT